MDNGRKRACFCSLGLRQPPKESPLVIPPGVEGSLLLEPSLLRTTRTPEGKEYPYEEVGPRASAMCANPSVPANFPDSSLYLVARTFQDDMFL